MADQEQTQKLKNHHANYISMPETRMLIRNLERKLNEQISVILAHSVLGKMTDSELRTKCAQAQAAKELIDYVSKDHSSIVG